jgi:hypothetical protein
VEVLVARDADEVLQALDRSDVDLLGIARRARERTLEQHTGYQRARTMLEAFESARSHDRSTPPKSAHSTPLEAA